MATQIIWMSPTKLRPNKHNPRTHSRKQVQQIANSIVQFGWAVPIVVDENNCVLSGHGRLEAANSLGLKKVPVIILAGLSEAKKRAFALADNKIAANAGWDRSLLATELSELSTLLEGAGLDLELTGFEAGEIDGLLGDFVDTESDPADQVAPVRNIPVSAAGDCWRLGDHRLVCGDATDPAAFKALMNGQTAAMLFTDPPYNVRVASVQGRGRIKHREFAQASGEMSPIEYVRFLGRWMALAIENSAQGSIHYICIDWRHVADLIAAGATPYGQPKNVIVWVKTNAGQGSFYRSQHELIVVFKNGDESHINNFGLGRHGRNRSNVWTYPGVNSFGAGRMADLMSHPTVKPVALVADAMRDCSSRRDIILDPFLGSGTTILAAERVGRRGFGLEIDPLYVDVAVRRWQQFTGRDPILQADGRTFDEVAAQRTPKPEGGAR